MLAGLFFQQQKGGPANQDQKEQFGDRPWQSQHQAAGQSQKYFFSGTNFRIFQPIFLYRRQSIFQAHFLLEAILFEFWYTLTNITHEVKKIAMRKYNGNQFYGIQKRLPNGP
jgi:hypothetical protein